MNSDDFKKAYYDYIHIIRLQSNFLDKELGYILSGESDFIRNIEEHHNKNSKNKYVQCAMKLLQSYNSFFECHYNSEFIYEFIYELKN